ncbi:hypothetical protein PISMIDRAFT_20111 [Pisolithus microcarpus 441]|uniref:Uncharacterized protein n=1 Tax=Pisolithus microcarpus 441 TaxID=765257 RepID=A0A0C9YRX6_9AGAM|nr:hypothetical protein PISMIDRAFT_20111 [Pisolithus microcarpus 441]
MLFSWLQSREESYPLTPLDRNDDSSVEHNISSSSTNTNEHNAPSSLSATMPMNIDNPWNDVTSLSLSKSSKEIENPVDGRVTVAGASGVAEESASTVNIRETTAVMSGVVTDAHPSATMPVETVENPWSEASENTTVVMRSIGSGPGKRSAFANAARAGMNPIFHL